MAARDVRVDAGSVAGGVVGSDYDPMLAKVIAWGRDRAEALRRLDRALGDTVLLGVGTNVGFLRALLADPDVRAGRLDTGLIDRRIDELAAADAAARRPRRPRPCTRWPSWAAGPVVDPFDVPGGWRLGAPACDDVADGAWPGATRWRCAPAAGPPTPWWRCARAGGRAGRHRCD